jgi:hypothetical protein
MKHDFVGTLTPNGWSTSRAETIAAPAWRAQVLRADGSVRCEYRGRDATGHGTREWFAWVPLQPGETARYQIRHPGKSRFLTFGRRP